MSSNRPTETVADHWVILVGGYGAYLFRGSEAEAEDERVHKARWEHGIGKKRRATAKEISEDSASQCWNHPGFNNSGRYECDCEKCDPW